MIESPLGLRSALEATGEPGSAELCDVLREMLNETNPARHMIGLRRLKARVYRLEIGNRGPWRSVVLKRLEPAVAQRARLVAERWLPALGLGDRCALLLGVAADCRGESVWHVYEDLGDETLVAQPAPERVEATVDLVAELHTRAARHAVLPDVRRYGGGLGMPYFMANVGDAIASLDALEASGIETPPEHAGLPGRLRERLIGLLAEVPRRARAFEQAAGPDTLLHGDLWTINAFVAAGAGGLRARLVDWDRVGVGPFSYDLSAFLFRFPAAQRPWILERYRHAVSRAGWRLGSPSELDLLFDTAERARYANRVIWPVLALLRERAAWGFPELAEVERWFLALDAGSLNERPQVPERPDARPLARASGAVAFRGVCLAAGPDAPVLHDVSFEIKPGTRLGIVGAAGAGKTALIRLLTRSCDPTEGQVLLDGVDLRDYKLDDLRRQFAVVSVEPVLLPASIAENIAYAVPGARREQIVAGARAANAHEFIERLPQGYDTQVGGRGVSLSPSQRQRIALARAFLEDSPVLILDDSVASMDPDTEAAVGQALERLQRGRTVISLSHRPTTLAGCSAVLTIEHGRVVRDTAPVPIGERGIPTAERRRAPASAKRRETLLAHPAVQAWGRLSPERLVPERIRALRGKTGRKRKRGVYRLEGVGHGGSAVVAKQCRRADAVIERIVYEEVLPSLKLPLLRYYGCVENPDGEFHWLFMEEAAGEAYSPLVEAHRAHAGRWLGLLHAGAASVGARERLPDAGPDRYLRHLRSAREQILEGIDNPVLTEEDVAFFEGLVARLDELDEGWGLLEEACHGVPETLVHGDFNSKNLRVRTMDAGPGITAFDWEDSGWGVPAIDLAQVVVPWSRLGANPDLATYWSVVRERLPDSTLETVRRLGDCGTVFRALAAIEWDSHQLAHDWAESCVRSTRLYEGEMAHALDRLGWRGDPS